MLKALWAVSESDAGDIKSTLGFEGSRHAVRRLLTGRVETLTWVLVVL